MSGLDAVDKKIVDLLAKDGRRPHDDIGKAVNLSRPAVHARIKRLQEAGVIRGYSALVDWRALGRGLTTLIWVRTGGVPCLDAANQMLRLSGDVAVIEECHRVAGEWCLVLKVRAASTDRLQVFIDQLREVPGVQATMSTIVLSTLVDQGRPVKGV
jgi:Lrp/AsnC family transcriptional regulator, leucine-responsive regulatory protein